MMEKTLFSMFKKKLNDVQQKCPIIEREAYAIISAINKLRHYLLGSKFTVYTDHKPLRTLFTSEMKNARIQRWTIMLEEYGCDVQYKQGKINIQADMPSRIQVQTDDPDFEIDIIDSSDPKTNSQFDSIPESKPELITMENYEHMALSQQDEPELRQIIDVLVSDECDDRGQADYVMQGLLNHVAQPARLDSSPHLQLVIPKKLQRSIIEELHSGEYVGGHIGIDKNI